MITSLELAGKTTDFARQVCRDLDVPEQHVNEAAVKLAHELSITIDEFVKQHSR